MIQVSVLRSFFSEFAVMQFGHVFIRMCPMFSRRQDAAQTQDRYADHKAPADNKEKPAFGFHDTASLRFHRARTMEKTRAVVTRIKARATGMTMDPP